MPPALRVNALRGGHVALGALPAAEAEAAALGVLPVATTQHRTGCCEIKHDRGINRHVLRRDPERKAMIVGTRSLLVFSPFLSCLAGFLNCSCFYSLFILA